MARYPHPDDTLHAAERAELAGQPRLAADIMRFAEAWAAERVVLEQLADSDPVVLQVGLFNRRQVCGLCRAAMDEGVPMEHSIGCPWKLAQRWSELAALADFSIESVLPPS